MKFCKTGKMHSWVPYSRKAIDVSAVTTEASRFLSIPGKVLAGVLLNRLSSQIDQFLPEAQCGFRAGRGTVDMVFSLKQVQEKCIEQKMPLYMVFVDFTKAFDTE